MPADIHYLDTLLGNMEKLGASDLHLKAGAPPIFRVGGTPQRIKADALAPDDIRSMVWPVLNERSRKLFEELGAADFAYSLPAGTRFRISFFRQRGLPGLAARLVNSVVPTIQELRLPESVAKITEFNDGIVLVVGATGSGKSSTLAALIDAINHKDRVHILTIEDPIEYVYQDDKAFVNQREIGLDVPDFHIALRQTVREDPDVILLGEMRDRETIEAALTSAETGHLVLGTMHSTNAVQTIARILDFFEPSHQPGVRSVLSYVYRAAIAQRLIPSCRPKEAARVPAVEVMYVNSVIRKHIAEGEEIKIGQRIREGARDGMQDFNMAFYKLVKSGWITEETALEHSSQPEQLAMQLKGMVLNQDSQTI